MCFCVCVCFAPKTFVQTWHLRNYQASLLGPGTPLLTWFNLSPSMDKYSHARYSVGWNYLSIPKLQRCKFGGSLEMDKWFHPTLYNVCNYVSMLGLKLIHVNKSGPCRYQKSLSYVTRHIGMYYCATVLQYRMLSYSVNKVVRHLWRKGAWHSTGVQFAFVIWTTAASMQYMVADQMHIHDCKWLVNITWRETNTPPQKGLGHLLH